jgi:hypothetical protein
MTTALTDISGISGVTPLSKTFSVLLKNFLLLPEFELQIAQSIALASLYEQETIIASFNGIHPVSL